MANAESMVPTSSLPTSFTCLSCKLGFDSSEAQRAHFQSSFHSYNLKRKTAGMVPVSLDNFRMREAAQLEKEKEEAKVR